MNSAIWLKMASFCSAKCSVGNNVSQNVSHHGNFSFVLDVFAGADPGFPVEGAPSRWGGANLQHGHFLAKMYAKTKELDPIGGGAPAAPPRSANDLYVIFQWLQWISSRFRVISGTA